MNYDELITPKEAAKILRCTVGTLANWRTLETGPCFTKMPNGRVYYTKDSINEYLHETEQTDKIQNTRLVPISVILSCRSGTGINMV